MHKGAALYTSRMASRPSTLVKPGRPDKGWTSEAGPRPIRPSHPIHALTRGDTKNPVVREAMHGAKAPSGAHPGGIDKPAAAEESGGSGDSAAPPVVTMTPLLVTDPPPPDIYVRAAAPNFYVLERFNAATGKREPLTVMIPGATLTRAHGGGFVDCVQFPPAYKPVYTIGICMRAGAAKPKGLKAYETAIWQALLDAGVLKPEIELRPLMAKPTSIIMTREGSVKKSAADTDAASGADEEEVANFQFLNVGITTAGVKSPPKEDDPDAPLQQQEVFFRFSLFNDDDELINVKIGDVTPNPTTLVRPTTVAKYTTGYADIVVQWSISRRENKLYHHLRVAAWVNRSALDAPQSRPHQPVHVSWAMPPRVRDVQEEDFAPASTLMRMKTSDEPVMDTKSTPLPAPGSAPVKRRREHTYDDSMDILPDDI